jgi:hypothetical protein
LAERVRVAAGFEVISALGGAEVVLLKGSAAAPQVVDSRWVELSDPAVPESRQPYHDETGALRKDGPELTRLIASVEQFGRRAVIEVINRWEREGCRLDSVAIVVGTLVDPDTFDNERMRSHALEQRLLRRISEDAGAQQLLPCVVFHASHSSFLRERVDRRAYLECVPSPVFGRLCPNGMSAALAAWLVLADSPPATRIN